MSGTDLDRETLDAFIDGELPASEMTRAAALVAAQAELRRYVEEQERLRRTLQDSFAPLMNEPIAKRVRQMVEAYAAKPARQSASWSGGLGQFFSWRAIGLAAAMAAGLLVGIAVDRIGLSEEAFLESTSNGQTVARGELARVLSEKLAADQDAAKAVRVGLSFRSKDGDDCRTFTWDGARNSTSGIACHSKDAWVVAALATQAPDAQAHALYQIAGASMPDAIRRAVNEMIAGRPFDAAAERAARASQWSGAKAH